MQRETIGNLLDKLQQSGIIKKACISEHSKIKLWRNITHVMKGYNTQKEIEIETRNTMKIYKGTSIPESNKRQEDVENHILKGLGTHKEKENHLENFQQMAEEICTTKSKTVHKQISNHK